MSVRACVVQMLMEDGRFNNKKFTRPAGANVCACASNGGWKEDVEMGRRPARGREGRLRKNLPAGNHSSPGVKLSFGKINPPRYGGGTTKNEIV